MVASVGGIIGLGVSGEASVIVSVGTSGGADVIGFSGWKLSIVVSVAGIVGNVVVAEGIAESSVIIASVGAFAGPFVVGISLFSDCELSIVV